MIDSAFQYLKDHEDEFNHDLDRRGKLAEELMKEDPKLTFISAIVIAGDKLQAERAKRMMEAGVPFDEALVLTGSFGRMELALWALKEGYTTDEHVIKILPELWSGSDPDDTDPDFFLLWLDAWERNNKKTILDGAKLPAGKYLTIYRGQDEDAEAGISWSLNEKVANKFANGAATRQHNRRGIVYKAMVNRKNVIAYLTGRGEDEVIVSPFHVEPWSRFETA